MSILKALEQAEATIRERDAEIARIRADARSYANVMLSEENDRLIAEIERLRDALLEMIEISKRNSEASLMLLAIRKCAQHALERKP